MEGGYCSETSEIPAGWVVAPRWPQVWLGSPSTSLGHEHLAGLPRFYLTLVSNKLLCLNQTSLVQRWSKRVERAWLVRLLVQQVAIQPWNSPAAGSSPRRGSAAGAPPGQAALKVAAAAELPGC